MAQKRTVVYENNEILYLLEQKQVKNLNLRVHKDCMVYVSANPDDQAEKVDDFVVSKGAYIRSAQRKFREMAQYAPQPKQYVSGETFYLLGRGVRLKVENSLRDAISSDGIYLHLCVKDTEDFVKKQKMVTRYLESSVDPFSVKLFWRPTLYFKNMGYRCQNYGFGIWRPDGVLFGQKGIVTLN